MNPEHLQVLRDFLPLAERQDIIDVIVSAISGAPPPDVWDFNMTNAEYVSAMLCYAGFENPHGYMMQRSADAYCADLKGYIKRWHINQLPT